jgi:hypothetical protein
MLFRAVFAVVLAGVVAALGVVPAAGVVPVPLLMPAFIVAAVIFVFSATA